MAQLGCLRGSLTSAASRFEQPLAASPLLESAPPAGQRAATLLQRAVSPDLQFFFAHRRRAGFVPMPKWPREKQCKRWP